MIAQESSDTETLRMYIKVVALCAAHTAELRGMTGQVAVRLRVYFLPPCSISRDFASASSSENS